jgi:peptidoglycan-N-acetylglucosamine deacetylase
MSGRRVTLTFDNGPTPGITEGVLDILADHGIKSNFFVIGRELAAPGSRALSERAIAEGHRVGNHTMTHTLQFGEVADPEFGVREIDEAQAVIGDLAGEEKLFRPYGGGGILSPLVLTRRSVDHLAGGGYTCVLWNSVPHDWDGPDTWVERALADVAAQTWTVVVIHDQATGAMVHLGEFIAALADQGVEIRQDFPDSCVPMRRGVLIGSLDELMAPEGAPAGRSST